MTDRELLEMAAKAAGIDGAYFYSVNPIHCGIYQARGRYYWNPLISDSEALRLAVKLGISITPYPIYSEQSRHSVTTKQRRHADTLRQANPTECIELYGSDPCAATRRAIVRAAAAIGANKD